MATSNDNKSSDPHEHTKVELHDNIRLGDAGNGLLFLAAGIGVIGLGAAAALGMQEGDGFRRFSYAYVTAFMWLATIGVGALFWVALQNLTNARWSIVLRRVGEILATNAPALAVLALPIVVPIVLGHSPIYAWSDHEKVEQSHILEHKAPYLNPTFFLIRYVVYFGFWALAARYFLKTSLKQDETGKANIPDSMQRASGPIMIGFGLTVTFFAFDLLMSLDSTWFSTIFGVYYFASCVLSFHSFLVLAALWLQGKNRLKTSVTPHHYHDVGKMMFAFTIFWAYIGFSQFMLIWYANIPEETVWFKVRFAGVWANVSWTLLFAHFVIPFFGLLSRHVKRNKKALAFWAVWILAVVYLDMYWLVMPSLETTELPLKFMDIACWVGVSGLFIAVAAFRAKSYNLIPTKDPRLAKSLAFENI